MKSFKKGSPNAWDDADPVKTVALAKKVLAALESNFDVEDGDYGQPAPGMEMRLSFGLYQALGQDPYDFGYGTGKVSPGDCWGALQEIQENAEFGNVFPDLEWEIRAFLYPEDEADMEPHKQFGYYERMANQTDMELDYIRDHGASVKIAKFKCQECGKILPETARKCSKCGSEDIDLHVGSTNYENSFKGGVSVIPRTASIKLPAQPAVTKEGLMKTARNVEAQVKAAASDLTKLAKHRVALAYAVACGSKTASTSTARRRMVEAFLTMPTFALEQIHDMHQASQHTAADDEMPIEDSAPEAPAEGGEDLGAEMDMGMDDLGGGAMGGPGAEVAPEASPELEAMKQENEALVADIQQLEQDFAKLQEVLPEGGALDLSSILSEESLDAKAEQLPEGGEGEDPALNLVPEEPKVASMSADDVDDDSFEKALFGKLSGADFADMSEQVSDPALPEQVGGIAGDQLSILEQVDVEDVDYVDLPSNILGDLAAAAGTGVDNGPAMPKAAAKKVASVSTGARFLPSGTITPASTEDAQVGRLASLLSQF